MWKRIALLAAALLVIAGSLAFAAERTSRKPVVVVLYQNHAETDYNKAIDKKFMKNFKAALPDLPTCGWMGKRDEKASGTGHRRYLHR